MPPRPLAGVVAEWFERTILGVAIDSTRLEFVRHPAAGRYGRPFK